MLFPAFSRLGEGDLHVPRPGKVVFAYGARRVFLNEDGRALHDHRFSRLVINACQRHEAAGEKELCYRDSPGGRDLNIRGAKMAEKKELARKMIILTESFPGTVGGAREGGERNSTRRPTR